MTLLVAQRLGRVYSRGLPGRQKCGQEREYVGQRDHDDDLEPRDAEPEILVGLLGAYVANRLGSQHETQNHPDCRSKEGYKGELQQEA